MEVRIPHVSIETLLSWGVAEKIPASCLHDCFKKTGKPNTHFSKKDGGKPLTYG